MQKQSSSRKPLQNRYLSSRQFGKDDLSIMRKSLDNISGMGGSSKNLHPCSPHQNVMKKSSFQKTNQFQDTHTSGSDSSLDSIEDMLRSKKHTFKSHKVDATQIQLFERRFPATMPPSKLLNYHTPKREFRIKTGKTRTTMRSNAARTCNNSPDIQSVLPREEIQKIGKMVESLLRTQDQELRQITNN